MKKMLWLRKIRPSPLCVICHLEEKSVLHTLRECSFAKEVWDLTNIEITLLTGNRKNWINNNIHAYM